MLFLSGSLLFFVLFMIMFYKRSEKPKRFSQPILVLFLFSLLVNVSLAQNYTTSLIPEAYDGIGISNFFSYMIITDNVRWSRELFKTYYNISTIVSFFLLILYSILLIIEKPRLKRDI